MESTHARFSHSRRSATKMSQICMFNSENSTEFCTSNFRILHISQPFFFYPRREMTCFAVFRRLGHLTTNLLSTDLQSVVAKFTSTIVVDSLFASQTNWDNRQIIAEFQITFSLSSTSSLLNRENKLPLRWTSIIPRTKEGTWSLFELI